MEPRVRWAVAERLGVACNLDLPFPNAALDRCARVVLGECESFFESRSSSDAWSPEALPWALLEVLRALPPDPVYQPLRGYLQAAGEGAGATRGRRAFGFARQLADLFDRYAVFRPDWARAWSRGQAVPGLELPPEQTWQPALWKLLQEHLDGIHGSEGGAWHGAERLARAAARLRGGEAPELDLERLSVLGVAALPPASLDFLAALGHVLDLHLFQLAPSRRYWSDIRSRREEFSREDPFPVPANPLLRDLGAHARFMQDALLGIAEDVEETDCFELPDLPEPAPLLLRLQRDCVEGVDPRSDRSAPLELPEGDDSFQVHACHGPTRQVEVLRDVLVALLDTHPHLQPRDVLVLTPDIERFAPLVAAVFRQGEDWGTRGGGATAEDPGEEGWEETERAPGGLPRLPFRIHDLSLTRTNPLAAGLVAVLGLVEARLECTAVLDLLNLAPLRRRFGIETSEVETLQGWLREVGVRWGRDASHRAAHGQPEDPRYTWRSGIERLVLGAAMADAPGRLYRGVVPFDPMEGEALDLLGRFLDFLDTLFEALDDLRAPRPPEAWKRDLARWFDRLLEAPEERTWWRLQVLDELQLLERGGEEEPVERDLVLAWMQERFSLTAPRLDDGVGAVTVTSMAPNRGVPFRVVCLLGLDEGRFPRRVAGPTYDLTTLSCPGGGARPGDRDPREEDRYRFLEALLAAGEHLVLLYEGRDLRSNEERAPALPVRELQEVVRTSFREPPRVREHPLQGFSPRSFGAGGGSPWSYDPRGLEAARAVLAGRLGEQGETPRFLDPHRGGLPPVPEVETEWNLEDLVRRLTRPCRSLLRERLGVPLVEEAEDPRPDREPLELDGLERWVLAEEIRQGQQRGSPPEDLRTRVRGECAVPLGTPGALVLASSELRIQRAEEALVQLGGAGAGCVKLRNRVGGVWLEGDLEGVSGTVSRTLVVGSPNGKRMLRAWCELLLWTLAEEGARLRVERVYSPTRGDPVAQAFELSGAGDGERLAEARENLEALLVLARRSLEEPLPLFERTSPALAEALRDQLEPASREALLRRAKEGLEIPGAVTKLWKVFGRDTGDADRPEVLLLLPDYRPWDRREGKNWVRSDFLALALAVYGPPVRARIDLSPGGAS